MDAHPLLLPLLAMLIDLVLADPPWLPHPVRWLGRAARWLEFAGRDIFKNDDLFLFGALCTVLLAVGAAALAGLAAMIPYVGWLAGLYLASSGLALRGLWDEGRMVARLIEAGHLDAARKALAMLVSRDTGAMGPDELRRTLAETLSENLNDAFVAPFFYLALLGLPGLWAYKAVSTLDSMWGYRTAAFKFLGRFCARTDDVLAYVPARFASVCMLLAGAALGHDWRSAAAKTAADAGKMESPNAGWPMAAAAWLLAGSMGGAAVYFGQPKEKPVLGPAGQAWTDAKLTQLLRLVFVSGLLAALLLLALAWAIHR